jgi:hypothetical protein
MADGRKQPNFVAALDLYHASAHEIQNRYICLCEVCRLEGTCAKSLRPTTTDTLFVNYRVNKWPCATPRHAGDDSALR